MNFATKQIEHARPKNRQVSMLIITSIPSFIDRNYVALPYKWKQELGEVAITVPVPKGTRARDLVVSIQKKKLSVGLKGKDKIMDGELCKEIKVDESTWSIGKTRLFHRRMIFVTVCMSEDQQEVLIHLEKVNQQQWWENVLTHHPKIDTTKIQPENSKLSDLDGETRYAFSMSCFTFRR